MKAFIKEYPEFTRLSGTVTRHVSLMGELSRLVEKLNLLEVSSLQQDIAVNHDHSKHLRRITEMITNRETDAAHLLHLAMLYALRYETQSDNSTHKLMELLRESGCSIEEISVRLSHIANNVSCSSSLSPMLCGIVVMRVDCPASFHTSLSSRRPSRPSHADCKA